MADILPLDPTTIESVADVEPHYEVKESVTHALDSLVDPELMRDYTFSHVHEWTTLMTVAGDVYTSGYDKKGRRNVSTWKAFSDRGLESAYGNDRKVDDILDALDPWYASYQAEHPFMTPRFPFISPYNRDPVPLATEKQTKAYVGAFFADRLARFEAFETLRQSPRVGDWITFPKSKDRYIRSYELDHISGLMDDVLVFGHTGTVSVYTRKNNQYGMSAPDKKSKMRALDMASVNGPAVAVSALRTAFDLYDEMTVHYETGQKLESWERPLDEPEIALAHEYVYTAQTLAERFRSHHKTHKEDSDRYYSQLADEDIDNAYVDTETGERCVRLRDMYGDALAGLEDGYESAVFRLFEKYRDRVDGISRDVGKMPRRRNRLEQHRKEHADAYGELAAISTVLHSAIESEHLSVNSVLQEEISELLERIDAHCDPKSLELHYYRYGFRGTFEGYDARYEKRMYRNYPPNRDAVDKIHLA